MESKTESVKATLVSLPRFGDFAYRETDVIEFPWGMPGFDNLHRWLILTLDSQPSFVWLQSLDDVNVAMPATNPLAVFDEYDPRIPAHVFSALQIRNADEFTILCTVTVSPGARDMTMNLAAPIVVNLHLRKALQVGLEGGRYNLAVPVPRKSGALDALTAKAS